MREIIQNERMIELALEGTDTGILEDGNWQKNILVDLLGVGIL